MGQSFPKPNLEETPGDWVIRCGFGYYVNPWLDNLAGWTESMPQIPSYPRQGTFDPGYLASAHRIIYGNIGDPNWDFEYMKEGYDAWYKLKSQWDKFNKIYTPKIVLKGLPKPNKKTKKQKPKITKLKLENQIQNDINTKSLVSNEKDFVTMVVQSQSPHVYPEINDCPKPSVKNPILTTTVPELYPVTALAALKVNNTSSEASGAITKQPINKKSHAKVSKKSDVDDDDLDSVNSASDSDESDSGSIINPPPLNSAFVWTRSARGINTKPPSLGELKTILDLLPPHKNPIHFVNTLISCTRNCQLTGADYRFILQNKLGTEYDEPALIENVPLLSRDNDAAKKRKD